MLNCIAFFIIFIVTCPGRILADKFTGSYWRRITPFQFNLNLTFHQILLLAISSHLPLFSKRRLFPIIQIASVFLANLNPIILMQAFGKLRDPFLRDFRPVVKLRPVVIKPDAGSWLGIGKVKWLEVYVQLLLVLLELLDLLVDSVYLIVDLSAAFCAIR